MKVESLILLPLEVELSAFKTAWQSMGLEMTATSAGKIDGAFFPQLRALCIQGGFGKTQFALRAQHAVDQLKDCERLICVGTAGSLSPSLKSGDIVVATSTVEHDFHNLMIQKRKLPEFNGDPNLISKAEKVRSVDFNVQFGKIASGDEDVVSLDRATAIREKTGALAVAWEGAGLGRVGKFNRIPHLEVRAISDSSNEAALTDFKNNFLKGMQNAAQFLRFVLD